MACLVSIAVANAPLAVAAVQMMRGGHGWECAWRVWMHNPNQYLFLLAFFPIAAVCVASAAARIVSIGAALDLQAPDSASWRRFCAGLPYACLALVALIGAVTVGSVFGSERDYSQLAPALQCRTAKAASDVFEMLDERPLRTAQCDELKTLVGGFDPSSPYWKSLVEAPARESVPAFLDEHWALVAGMGPNEALTVLEAPVVSLSDKVRLVQVSISDAALHGALAQRPHLANEALVWANTAELPADLVVVGILILTLAAMFAQRPCVDKDDEWKRLSRQAVFLLIMALAMFLPWVAFRAYAVGELLLLSGGNQAWFGDYIAGGLLILGCGVFLFALLVEKEWADFVGTAYPIASGLIVLVFAALDPVRAGAFFGVVARWQTVAIFAAVYILLVSLSLLRIFLPTRARAASTRSG